VLQLGIGEVLEHPSGAPRMDRRPRSGGRPMAATWLAGGASESTTTACLLEELVAVDEGAGVGRPAVVGTAPRHEVQLAGLPGSPSFHKGLQQRSDGRYRERAGEELRLGVRAMLLGGLGDRRPGLLAAVAQLRRVGLGCIVYVSSSE
jgi:hypothetical protein